MNNNIEGQSESIQPLRGPKGLYRDMSWVGGWLVKVTEPHPRLGATPSVTNNQI
jgi:hypothetical protein